MEYKILSTMKPLYGRRRSEDMQPHDQQPATKRRRLHQPEAYPRCHRVGYQQYDRAAALGYQPYPYPAFAQRSQYMKYQMQPLSSATSRDGANLFERSLQEYSTQGRRDRSVPGKKAPAHPLNQPYQCDICSEGFFDQSHLRDHRQQHFPTRQGACQWCNPAEPLQQQCQKPEPKRTRLGLFCATCGKLLGGSPYQGPHGYHVLDGPQAKDAWWWKQ